MPHRNINAPKRLGAEITRNAQTLNTSHTAGPYNFVLTAQIHFMRHHLFHTLSQTLHPKWQKNAVRKYVGIHFWKLHVLFKQ